MKKLVSEEQNIAQENEDANESEVPFILGFLEYREGAMAPTTSGTFADIDAADPR